MCTVKRLRHKPKCEILGWTKGGRDKRQHALGLSSFVAPLLHFPDAVQHRGNKVGAEEQAHNGEALPLGIQRTLGVSLERMQPGVFFATALLLHTTSIKRYQCM